MPDYISVIEKAYGKEEVENCDIAHEAFKKLHPDVKEAFIFGLVLSMSNKRRQERLLDAIMAEIKEESE